MKKRLLLLLLSALLVLSACSSKPATSEATEPEASQEEASQPAASQSDESEPAETQPEETQTEEQPEAAAEDETAASDDAEGEAVISEEAAQALAALEPLSSVTVTKNDSTVELTLPEELVDASTQEELDALAEESGFESITLHEDGSATYIMTPEQHELMMTGVAEGIQEKLDELMDAGGYTSFTDLQANSDFTEFTITTTSTELDSEESLSLVALYMYGGMYHIFDGTPTANIHVDYVNADSGDIIESADSSQANGAE